MDKLGRNDLCWCGSGKKFKKCHLDRDRESPLTIHDVDKSHKRSASRTCLHPDAPTGCDGPIIQAHTIQRSGGLSRIARSGQVYGFTASVPLAARGERLSPRLIGTKQASTFTGFCSAHDTKLFRRVEAQPFMPGDAEQVFLLGYRAVCFELYQKGLSSAFIPTLKEMDRGLIAEDQALLQEMMSVIDAGTTRGLAELRSHKRRQDDIIRARDFATVRGYVIGLGQCPDILCSAALCPEFDFAGREVQRLRPGSPRFQWLSMSFLPTATGGAAVFGWFADEPLITSFVRSLDAVPDDALPHALVRLCFEYCSNTFLSPDWWDALSPGVRENLSRRMREGRVPTTTPVALQDDGVRAVSWSVTARTRLGW